MKVNKMTWMEDPCVKVTARRLLGKQHLCMALGMVNICTVKAPEFNPSSLPASFCCLRLSAQENRTINNHRKKKARLLYPQLVHVGVLWQLQSLDLFSAYRRGALHNKVTPRRHVSGGVVREHTYLFSDNSLHTLNATGR